MLSNQYVDINMILNELNDETNAVKILWTSDLDLMLHAVALE